MKRLLLLLCFLLGVAPASGADLNLTLMGVSGGGASYVGPGDVVSGATAWYGLRAYNAAYAATPGKSVNLRRASDNVACDVNVATTGGLGLTTATCNSSTQGGITATAFAGTDATATCTLATTTATCASASSTPHVGSTVAGASLTQPCLITAVGTFTGGAGTFTTSLAGTSTPCGTISVGETFTMTYGLFVTEAYDQTGNGHDVLQATAGNQPQLFPNAGFYNGPALAFSNATTSSLSASSNFTPVTGKVSFSAVYERTANFTGGGLINENSNNNRLAAGSSSNLIRMLTGGGTNISATSTDSVPHAANTVLNGASSVFNVDGTETTGSLTGVTTAGAPGWGTGTFSGLSGEAGFWDNVAFTTGSPASNAGQVCGNQAAWYSTSIGTNC